MARPSSITKKSQASRAAPWTVTKNCRDPFIFREVKKGAWPIAVLSSPQLRSRKDQHAPVLPMTHFLSDILRQPNELQRTIDFLLGAGRPTLDAATTAIRGARHVYLTGIGSSWHAVLTAGPLFHVAARPVCMQDAAELLQFATIPQDSAMIVISRSGRSVEIVNLLTKVRNSGVTVIGITNSNDGPLAKEAQISMVVPIEMDYAISVNTYSTLAATAGILASLVVRSWSVSLATSLARALEMTGAAIPDWQVQIAG